MENLSFREGCVGVGRDTCYRRWIVQSLCIIAAAVGCCSIWKRRISDQSARPPAWLPAPTPHPTTRLCWNRGTEDDNCAVHILPADEEKHDCVSRWKRAAAQRTGISHKDINVFLSFLKPDGPDIPLSIVFSMGFLRANKENPSQLNGVVAFALWHCYNLSLRGEAAL